MSGGLAGLGQWEWIILLLLALGFLAAELVSIRRQVKRDRADRAARSARSDDPARHPEG